jgi:hypothetical protein
VSALLSAPTARAARAVLREFIDPRATLLAWRKGPWAERAAEGDPAGLWLPDDPWEHESRQWVDLEHDRAREETGALTVMCDGPRWWRGGLSGSTLDGHVQCAETLRLWTAPVALPRLLELEVLPEEPEDGVRARVRATARDGVGFSVDLAPLGWGADHWELLVDRAHEAVVGSAAYVGDVVFKRVEALEIVFDEDLDARLFSRD